MRCLIPLCILLGFLTGTSFSRERPAGPEKLSPALEQVVDKAIANENALVQFLRAYTPLAESYIQGAPARP